MRTVIIGSGNVATAMAVAMQDAGFDIIQVFSRTEENAVALAEKIVGSTAKTNIAEITASADVYIFAVKDDVLPEIISQMPHNNGLWVHTAGSVPMDIFAHKTSRYGVMYPLQTFSKNRNYDFKTIPLFIEGNNQSVDNEMFNLSSKLSNIVTRTSSEQRKYLHLAAVFACNFSNHLYALASVLLEKHGLDYRVLLPLIDETAAKIHSIPPHEAQTGPAVRNDVNVIRRHLEMLEDDKMRNIYEIISNNISILKYDKL